MNAKVSRSSMLAPSRSLGLSRRLHAESLRIMAAPENGIDKRICKVVVSIREVKALCPYLWQDIWVIGSPVNEIARNDLLELSPVWARRMSNHLIEVRFPFVIVSFRSYVPICLGCPIWKIISRS